jgi:flagellar biosynthetic protein FlhB
MAEGGQNKTEKPTGKKLGEARSKGNVPKSRELSSTVTFLGGTVALYLGAGAFFEHTKQMMHDLWGNGFQMAIRANLDSVIFLKAAGHLLSMVAPVVITVVVLAVVVNFAQVGGLIASEAIKPNLAKLNPVRGLKQLFSGRSMVELAKTLLKLLLITYVVYFFIERDRSLYLPLVDMEVGDIIKVAGILAMRICIRASLVMLFLAILDFAYQKWRHKKDLMMTKQEVKEEHKQTEGNPMIKSKIRSAQRAIARRRMMSKVPKADVVLTNPTHFAVALAYHKGMDAPKVLAKGKDLVAHKIVRIARKHHVPIVQNPPLARALYQEVDLEETIPSNLYRAVAKVLAYIYQQRKRSV